MLSPHIPVSSGIYRITCTSTGKFYIGSSIDMRDRWQTHFRELRNNIHINSKMQHAWNKYGGESFTFEVIELVLSPFLLEREQYWLDTLLPFNEVGFNIIHIAGSSLGRIVSLETREKLRQANLGKSSPTRGKKLSPEHIEKLRISHLGHPGHWTGKKRDPEMIEKIAAKRRGQPGPNLGKKASPETIERLRASHMGNVQSEETRQKRMKTLILIAPDGTEHVVTGIGRFCLDHNLHSSALLLVAKGKASHHKGWKARFPD